MTEDVDPENPRPEGRYHVEAESTWYYVDDDLASTIATGLATDAVPGESSGGVSQITARTRE